MSFESRGLFSGGRRQSLDLIFCVLEEAATETSRSHCRGVVLSLFLQSQCHSRLQEGVPIQKLVNRHEKKAGRHLGQGLPHLD